MSYIAVNFFKEQIRYFKEEMKIVKQEPRAVCNGVVVAAQ